MPARNGFSSNDFVAYFAPEARFVKELYETTLSVDPEAKCMGRRQGPRSIPVADREYHILTGTQRIVVELYSWPAFGVFPKKMTWRWHRVDAEVLEFIIGKHDSLWLSNSVEANAKERDRKVLSL